MVVTDSRLIAQQAAGTFGLGVPNVPTQLKTHRAVGDGAPGWALRNGGLER